VIITSHNIPARAVFCNPESGISVIIGQKLSNAEQPIPEDLNEQRRLYGFPER
jgi:hypothetical protein